MIWLIFTACGGDDTSETASIFDTLMADYHGLNEDASWTYRDDSPETEDSELPDELNLLRVKHESEGLMEMRRGSRWVDSTDAGSIEWSVESGLVLEAWTLPGGFGGIGPIQIADERPDENPEVIDGDSTCTAEELTEYSTWFGIFEKAIVFNCMGGQFEGSLVFGRDVGLIKLQITDYAIDIVAPW